MLIIGMIGGVAAFAAAILTATFIDSNQLRI
jgi:gas vesicle protein